VIWDGDCGFCRRSVEHLRARAGDRIAFEPFQTAHTRFPDIPREAFAASVHLVEPDGRTSRGAEAVYRAVAAAGSRLPLLAHEWLPGFAALSEWGYRLVATHRPQADRILTWLVGDLVGPPSFRLTRFVFLRLLALVYLVAFVSLGVQVHGLIGEKGLLPAGELLDVARAARGDAAFRLLPTLGWLGAGDTALSAMCYGGAAAALLALLGLAPGPLFALCYVLYLSLVHLGQVFLSFQWDVLLTETGFLALLLAPWGHWRPRPPGREPPPPTVSIWLLRLLLFKLMFSSGLTKLTWGDLTWRDWSALDYHYWTQPIPTRLAWYASQLPHVVQRLSCALMLFAEVLLPFLVFAPRRPRRVALFGFVLLQVAIAATGNYGFFNLLALVLCVPLLDDNAWPTFLRAGLLGADTPGTVRSPRLRGLLVAPLAAILVLLSIPPLIDAFHSDTLERLPPGPLRRLCAAASPLLVSNSYGLFRTMTTTRPEIEIEGSQDGRDWQPFAFRYKPGDPRRAPPFVAPHMPRLDWQMWFAALRAERLVDRPDVAGQWRARVDPWLGRLAVAVLEGEPEVRALLGPSPFGEAPPRHVRLVLWQYRFTDGGRAWWERERVGVLAGPFALEAAPLTPPRGE